MIWKTEDRRPTTEARRLELRPRLQASPTPKAIASFKKRTFKGICRPNRSWNIRKSALRQSQTCLCIRTAPFLCDGLAVVVPAHPVFTRHDYVATLCHLFPAASRIASVLMKRNCISGLVVCVATAGCLLGLLADNLRAASDIPTRPPAVPLVTFDPYLSIWSGADRLTDDSTRHWTRREHSLVSLLRVDGKVFRLMGKDPAETPAFPQKSVQVLPTRTIYEFDDGQIHCTLTFLRPALPHDLDALALPLTYLNWQVRSVDGKQHTVAIYDSTSSQLTINNPTEKVEWARGAAGGLLTLRIGTVEQPVLGSSGDDHRLNWGYAYAAALSKETLAAIGPHHELVNSFVSAGRLPAQDDPQMPRAVNEAQPVMAFVFDLDAVGRSEG